MIFFIMLMVFTLATGAAVALANNNKDYDANMDKRNNLGTTITQL